MGKGCCFSSSIPVLPRTCMWKFAIICLLRNTLPIHRMNVSSRVLPNLSSESRPRKNLVIWRGGQLSWYGTTVSHSDSIIIYTFPTSPKTYGQTCSFTSLSCFFCTTNSSKISSLTCSCCSLFFPSKPQLLHPTNAVALGGARRWQPRVRPSGLRHKGSLAGASDQNVWVTLHHLRLFVGHSLKHVPGTCPCKSCLQILLQACWLSCFNSPHGQLKIPPADRCSCWCSWMELWCSKSWSTIFVTVEVRVLVGPHIEKSLHTLQVDVRTFSNHIDLFKGY